jgi:hypothetical protein
VEGKGGLPVKWYAPDGRVITLEEAERIRNAREHVLHFSKVCTQLKPRWVEVSTVCLLTDHNFTGEGPPVLYETMVFHNGESVDCHRYRTLEAAAVGHQAVCESWANRR